MLDKILTDTIMRKLPEIQERLVSGDSITIFIKLKVKISVTGQKVQIAL